jgi:hypothetical protein
LYFAQSCSELDLRALLYAFFLRLDSFLIVVFAQGFVKVKDCLLEQIVNFSTRKNKTLDLFITNKPSLVSKCKPLPGLADHDIVRQTIKYYAHDKNLSKGQYICGKT